MTTADVAGEHRPVGRVLSDCRIAVEPALRSAVDTLPVSMRHVAGYHFGWVDAQGHATRSGDGKMIRPALTLLSAAAVGGRETDAIPAAVAVELTHNFSLLHDDVMDGDRLRRHRETVWARFGVPMAVLAGDALWALALNVLHGCGQARGTEGVRILTAALMRLTVGQSADMDFVGRESVSLAECIEMAAGKTAAMLGCACALGALFGGAERGHVEVLWEFGERLGLAFQLADDLLGIWGDPSITGKPVHADLRNRKKSLPVVAAMDSGTASGRELLALYRVDRPLTESESVRAARLVQDAGGRGWAQHEADAQITSAVDMLHDFVPVPAAELASLARLIKCRDR